MDNIMTEYSHINVRVLGEEAFAADTLEIYESINYWGEIRNFFNRLIRRNYFLQDLGDTIKNCTVLGYLYAGRKSVDIKNIKGSESRAHDFDSHFLPLQTASRDRWLRIARAFMQGSELPPVELLQVGDTYYVRDGHHRVSVARSMGMKYIDAEVTALRFRHHPL
jgi:hypothetical protein